MYALKAALAALVAFPLVSATEPPPQDMLVFMNYPAIVRVDCDEGHGSAVRVGRYHFLSVAHVTSMHGCTVGDVPIQVTEQDGAHDFSQFDANYPGPRMAVSCEGFHAGEWIWATGYAHAMPFQTAIALYTTYAKHQDGKRILIGPYTVIPGMSGSAMLNVRGEVVGMVNAYFPGSNMSLSRDLRDTSVCADKRLLG
jgi:hypothetical protein